MTNVLIRVLLQAVIRVLLQAVIHSNILGNSVPHNELTGMARIKIPIDAETKKILEATLGIGSEEIVHSILDVMYADTP